MFGGVVFGCEKRRLGIRSPNLWPWSITCRLEAIATRSKDAIRGLTTRSKKLLGAPGIATRGKDTIRLEASLLGWRPSLVMLQ